MIASRFLALTVISQGIRRSFIETSSLDASSRILCHSKNDKNNTILTKQRP